jgi:hypothetical protein
VVFEGQPAALLRANGRCLAAQYLRGEREIAVPPRRPPAELKEAYARAQEHAAAAEVTATARERFVHGHLATLAAGLAGRLQSVSAPDLELLAEVLRERTGPGAPAPADHEVDSEPEIVCGEGVAEGEPDVPPPIAPARAPR